MKRNAIVRIVLWSLVIVILTGILITGLSVDLLRFTDSLFSSSYGEKLEGGTVSSSGTVNAEKITDIDIEWAAGTILIQTGDVDRIEFSESGASEDHKMTWKQNGKKLTIHFSENEIAFSGFGVTISDTHSKDLTITVPRKWQCGSLSIDVAYADVEIHNMAIEEIDFDGASGRCTFEDCCVDTLSVDTASGDIQYSGWLNVLDCDAASADCVIEVTNTPSKIDLDSASGDLELYLPEDCGFSVSLDALSSDFSSDFPTAMQNGLHVFGDGSCSITVDAMSGDVTIHRSTR